MDQRAGQVVLDQVGESCTGQAVAALINTVLAEPPPEQLPEHGPPRHPTTNVSPYMLYAMARKYDEFPGQADVGSSLRGAFKGWYHHGVCSVDRWPYTVKRRNLDDPAFIRACMKTPLGAYYRVNVSRIDDMQSAISELNAIAVSAVVHEGWTAPEPLQRGSETMFVIRRAVNARALGGHAFALVGYNEVGFLVQNSWGKRWGQQGIAHWAYKEGSPSDDLAWLNRIMDWQADTNDPDQFMENLKTDLEHDEVFVFTPKGRVITLPVGSTPIDFAYAIHTEVGHACIGARVNGRLVPLDHVVQSGDTCEIFTSKVDRAGPSRDWLKIVQSPRARNKIRQWFSKERREDALESGRDELTDALRREGLPVQKILAGDALTREAAHLSYADVDAMFRAVGEHQVSGRSIAQRISRSLRSGEDDEVLPSSVRAPSRMRKGNGNVGIHVEGLDDLLVRLSRCCTPVPGDEITGFVTRGRGVSVHRADCANAVALMSDQSARLIEVEWDGNTSGAMFRASVEVKALDRSRLLRDVSNVLSEQHVNIVACSTHTGSDRVASMRFEFEMADPNHLDAVLRTIKNIDAVYDAYRIVPGGGRS
jgi:hypothetical protein